MKLAAAQALVRDLIAVERHPGRERDALDELAAWAYQFSGEIVVQPDGVLLETGASERLFGGRSRLSRAVRDGLQALGYRATFGYAVTPRAARVVALARARRLPCPHLFEASRLEGALAPLPFTLLGWDEAALDTLHALGLATIGDLLALPRASFAKRFGRERLDDLDRLLARRADPQSLYTPPERFAATIELPADVVDTAQLMFPAQRLLASLEGFLRGRGSGTTELRFIVTHDPRRARPQAPTEIRLTLAAPERDAKRLAALLGERLARVALPEPAVALALDVDRLQPFAAMNGSLLPQPAEPGIDWLKLAETLHARLGSERVFQLQAVDDHRPERAWRAVPLSIDSRGDRTGPAAAVAAPAAAAALAAALADARRPAAVPRSADAGHRTGAHRVRLVGLRQPGRAGGASRLLRRAQRPRAAAVGVPRTRRAARLVPARAVRMSAARPLNGADAMQVPYTELHCLSNFSFLRGASHPEELVARALALEYGGLAITDECSFAGSVRAHLELKDLRENDEPARSFRLIHGTEIQLTEGEGRKAAPGAKLVLLAQTRAGYGNLSQLVTLARRQAAKGSYRLSRRGPRGARRLAAGRARAAGAAADVARAARRSARAARGALAGGPRARRELDRVRTDARRGRRGTARRAAGDRRRGRAAARRGRRRPHARAPPPQARRRADGRADEDAARAVRPRCWRRTRSATCGRCTGSPASIPPNC